jgi:excisionase family DNA binding protein
MSGDPKLFDIGGAVEYFHEIGATAVTKNFIRNLIATGGIPHLKLGKKFYISKDSLDAWISRHERRNKLAKGTSIPAT